MVGIAKKIIGVLFLFSMVLLVCVGCSSDSEQATMPYSSSDYENGDWTVEELVDHLPRYPLCSVLHRGSRFQNRSCHGCVVGSQTQTEEYTLSIWQQVGLQATSKVRQVDHTVSARCHM